MQAVLRLLLDRTYALTREHWYSDRDEYFSYAGNARHPNTFTREERDLIIAHLRVAGHART